MRFVGSPHHKTKPNQPKSKLQTPHQRNAVKWSSTAVDPQDVQHCGQDIHCRDREMQFLSTALFGRNRCRILDQPDHTSATFGHIAFATAQAPCQTWVFEVACALTTCNTIRNETIRYDTIRYDTIRYDAQGMPCQRQKTMPNAEC